MEEAVTADVWLRAVRWLAHVVVAVVLGAAAVWWMLAGLYVWVFRCDEMCSGDPVEWYWTGQLVVAVAGAVLGLAAIGFSFTSRTERAAVLCTAALFCLPV